MSGIDIKKILHDAAHDCGFDGHVYTLKYKKDITNEAVKIMAMYTDLPVQYKASYLYCGTLDTCFYFNSSDDACCTFSGLVRYGTNDFENMYQTVEHIRSMLKRMNHHMQNAKLRVERNSNVGVAGIDFSDGTDFTVHIDEREARAIKNQHQKEIHENKGENDD